MARRSHSRTWGRPLESATKANAPSDSSGAWHIQCRPKCSNATDAEGRATQIIAKRRAKLLRSEGQWSKGIPMVPKARLEDAAGHMTSTRGREPLSRSE